jgi:hypothetical protein
MFEVMIFLILMLNWVIVVMFVEPVVFQQTLQPQQTFLKNVYKIPSWYMSTKNMVGKNCDSQSQTP